MLVGNDSEIACMTWVVCDAAWQNNPEEIAEVFKRVLHRDAWGLQQVIIACLSTGDQGTEKSQHKSNYLYFSEALCPGTTRAADEQDSKAADADVISQESP